MIEADTRKALLSLECELLCPETRRSKYRLSELLADEFVEFGSSGRVCDKHSVIDSLLQLDSTEHYQIDDFRLVNCCDHTAFVTYSCIARSDSGEIVRKSNRSSLWQLENGRWQIVFHQGTKTE
jgi:hypothetical protein